MPDKVKVLDEACQLLREMAQVGRSMTLAEVARVTGLPKSTAKRTLDTLEVNRFLDRDGDKYRIGLEMARLWAVYREEQNNTLAAAQMNLEQTKVTGEETDRPKMVVVTQ